MRGVIIVNRLNDVLYADIDEDLLVSINKQAVEQGLLLIGSDEDEKLHNVDTNVFMQLFAPLVMAQWSLIAQLKNPCTSVKCKNGYIFAFKQLDDLLLIAINGGDGTEDVNFLERKLSVLVQIWGFLFGLVPEEIGHPQFYDKEEKWRQVKLLTDIWYQQAKEEQSYLVEAVERLHVNQIVNERSIDLLEDIVRKFSGRPDCQTLHAMILVNSKVLSVYSSDKTQDLQTADILLINLLARYFYPMEEKLEDLFSFSHKKPEPGMVTVNKPASMEYYTPKKDRYESPLEGDDDDSDGEKFHSARTTPASGEESAAMKRTITPERSSHSSSGSSMNFPTVSQQQEGFYTPRTPNQLDTIYSISEKNESNSSTPRISPSAATQTSKSSSSGNLSDTLSSKPTNSSDTVKASVSNENSSRGDDDDESMIGSCYNRQTVFLRTASCFCMPHELFCVQIFPGISLTIITEKVFSGLASNLCQVLLLLRDLLCGKKEKITKSQVQYIYDAFSNLMSKVLNPLKRIKGSIERIALDIRQFWDKEETKNALLSYLREEPDSISSSLENTLTGLNNKLKSLFLNLYISPQKMSKGINQSLEAIQKKIKLRLGDFKDYLTVKAQRNITMTSYLEDFPGLIHFIYVDRQTNQMMAPSFNISREADTAEPDATELLKEKTWFWFQKLRQFLLKGYTTSMVTAGDFRFSYFVWFEDNAGNCKPVSKTFKGSKDMVPPGVIAGNFYRQLLRQCFPNEVPSSIHCYELFCMHIGLAPATHIANHWRKLTQKIWENSGEAFTPINLL